jgi:hypothetical protein
VLSCDALWWRDALIVGRLAGVKRLMWKHSGAFDVADLRFAKLTWAVSQKHAKRSGQPAAGPLKSSSLSTTDSLLILHSRGLEDIWQPPGAAAISVAAVVPGFAFYSCAGGKVKAFV